MNRFLEGLAAVCRDRLLDEKWLIAPSLRVGHQWLEAVTRGGQACCNVHVKTLKVFALDLASPVMVAEGLTLLPDRGAIILLDRIWRSLPRSEAGYLSTLRPSISMAEALYSSITALGLAGLSNEQVRAGAFEEDGKAAEIASVWKKLRAEALRHRRVEYAQVLRLALTRLREGDGLPESVLVLVPADVDGSALEIDMLAALTSDRCVRLPVDGAVQREPSPALRAMVPGVDSDAGLLRWFHEPAGAPLPKKDGTAEILRAVGEVNEVREVLRRCLAAGHRFDDVEILYTDADTYVPLVYELLLRLQPEEQLADGEVPATFADGIPCRYSRPGRALALWLAWIRDDFPQRTLIRMLQDGLLQLPGKGEETYGFGRLAGLLGSLAIGMGRDRYLRSVDQKIASLEAAAPSVTGNDDNDRDRSSNREIRLQGLRVVRKLVQDLLDGVPAVDSSQSNVLKAADRFLETQARALTRLDNFALEKLREEIREMERWIEKDEEPVSLNIWDWLEALPRKARALAGNPEPGKLHVAPILAGGHTARKHTFLVGLDDGRFPGAGLQDPILLDKERKLLSSNLRLASRQLRDKLDSFARLMARLRGSVTLCFSCHHLLEDREMFPSPVLLAAFRILSGNHDADQSDIRALAPVSFAPTDLAGCLDDGEWWLWQAEAEPVREPMTLVGTLYPHLGRGLDAAKARAGPAFTSYDGSVALAGRDRDPTAPDGPVMTASALQTIGRCPLAYFFQYVLGVRLPEEVGADPQHWLDPPVLGSLLHSVFEEFVRGLLREERLPEFERDYADLLGILGAEIEKYKVRYPIPSTGVFCKQYRQLRDTARIFLIEEEDYYRATGARPAFLEATIGYAHGPEATPLDTKDPVTLTLPGGKQFRACGRIDRIDLLGDAKGPAYAVWDYKTGGHKYYKKGDPFQQGRMIQNAFYQALAAERLQTISPGARLAYFGYFFPGVSSRGERITWTPAETAEGPAVMKNLLAIVANGAFAPTTDHGADCAFCAHRTACGDVALTAEGSKLKLEDPANTALQPFGELRAHGGG